MISRVGNGNAKVCEGESESEGKSAPTCLPDGQREDVPADGVPEVGEDSVLVAEGGCDVETCPAGLVHGVVVRSVEDQLTDTVNVVVGGG